LQVRRDPRLSTDRRLPALQSVSNALAGLLLLRGEHLRNLARLELTLLVELRLDLLPRCL